MKCYFDGSEGQDSSGDTWITLAGFAAADKSWDGFETRWTKMLHGRYPLAPYIHMWANRFWYRSVRKIEWMEQS